AEGDDAWAVRRLSEALVSFPDDEGLALILELARIRQRTGKPELAAELLEDAARRCRHAADGLAMIGEQAYHFGLGSLQIRVLEEAHKLDDRHYRALHDALIGNGQYERVVEVLQARFEVDRAQGDIGVALGRLVEAANCARIDLSDPARALELMLSAIDCEPRRSLIEHALGLTYELEDAECRIRLLDLLIDQSPPDEGRVELVRQRIETAEIIGDFTAEVQGLETLVALEAATDTEQVQLASLLFDTKPAQSAALYLKVAADRTSTDAGHLFFEACLAHREASNDEAAALACIESLKAGFRNLRVYEVALELLEGSYRADVLEDYLADGGDQRWDLHRNISIRLELASLRLDQDKSQQALVAIEQAAAFGETRELFNLRERALIQAGNMDALSEWYVSEADRANTEWGREEVIDRLKTAARYYRGQEAQVERQVVTKILDLGDREPAYFDRALTLAERDEDLTGYISLANQRLAIAVDKAEVEGLTLFLGHQLAEAFQEPDAAIGLWRERLEASPSVMVADALATLYDQRGDYRAGYEVYRYLMELVPSRRDIFNETLVRASTLGLWEDVCQLVFTRIERYETRDQEIAASLSRVAEICALDLIGSPMEFDAIERLLALRPGRQRVAAQLVAAYMRQDRLAEGLSILQAGRILEGQELDYASTLLDKIGEQAAGSELESTLIAWILEHHGETELGQRLKLEQARQGGDDDSLLIELERTLEHPALTMDDEESTSLHVEAAELALRSGDSAKALGHLLYVLDEEESSVEDVYQLLTLADEVTDGEK
ncbi:MAG: hypothetical protein VX834_08080, partial [Myxococcota bacterium]|nr:hypothetical protein [Myxococcota bacterium]